MNTLLFPNVTSPATDNELFVLEVPDGGNVGVLGTDNPVFPPSNTTAGYQGPVTTGSTNPDGSDEEAATAGATSVVVAMFSVLIACLFIVVA